ncbi:MAG: bifunctional oligoribonuclease/PAP phosphatase NrnA, partial [Proteobacteria bacterium]
DHHTSNSLFGSVNLVDEHASSTSEMIYHLLKAGSFEITKEVAICLFAGIMADTGSFRYSNTTQQTFLAAADLTHLGASSDLIGRAMFGNNSQGAVRLHALALSALKLHFDGKICELVVDDEMVKASGASVDDSDGLVEKGRDITGVLISFLIRWDGEIWRVSLRSREARYDVSKVAQIFGGGGHKSAAAFRWRKSLEELKPRLLVELEEACRQAESC